MRSIWWKKMNKMKKSMSELIEEVIDDVIGDQIGFDGEKIAEISNKKFLESLSQWLLEYILFN